MPREFSKFYFVGSLLNIVCLFISKEQAVSLATYLYFLCRGKSRWAGKKMNNKQSVQFTGLTVISRKRKPFKDAGSLQSLGSPFPRCLQRAYNYIPSQNLGKVEPRNELSKETRCFIPGPCGCPLVCLQRLWGKSGRDAPFTWS